MMIARLSLLNQGLCLLPNAVRGTSATGARYIRIWDVIRTHLGRGTTASAPRHGRTWGSVRYQLIFLCRPLLSLKLVLKNSLDWFPLHEKYKNIFYHLLINNSTAIRGVYAHLIAVLVLLSFFVVESAFIRRLLSAPVPGQSNP